MGQRQRRGCVVIESCVSESVCVSCRLSRKAVSVDDACDDEMFRLPNLELDDFRVPSSVTVQHAVQHGCVVCVRLPGTVLTYFVIYLFQLSCCLSAHPPSDPHAHPSIRRASLSYCRETPLVDPHRRTRLSATRGAQDLQPSAPNPTRSGAAVG